MRYDVIIGIDPGSNGGMAVWIDGRIETKKMPAKRMADFNEYLKYLQSISQKGVLALVEKVQFRHEDAEGGKMFRMEKLMANFERIKMGLELEKIPYVMVHPMTWQAALKLRKEGEEKEDRKRRYREVAGKMTGKKATLWNADAILIMALGVKKEKTDPSWIDARMPENYYEQKIW